MRLKVVLHRDEENGSFVAFVPALPGCHSQGSTREEALANVREAIEGCLLVLNERARPTRTGDDLAEVEV